MKHYGLRVFLRGCRRCGGDLILKLDLDGRYRQCLQCGCIVEPKQKKAVAA